MREYKTRQRYAARLHSDSLTQAGAEAIANKIRAFWFAKGKFPNVSLVKESVASAEGGSGLYCVRSNMRGGWPA